MAQTGSTIRFLSLSLFDWDFRQVIEHSEIYQEYIEGLRITLAALKEIAASHDLDQIIQTEVLTVLQERETFGKIDPTVRSSLNAAVADFEVISKSLQIVRNSEKYQAAASTYHAKKKQRGIVADGCHEAMNSHITRLGNRLATVGVSVFEKNIIRQRQSNMRVAKELYIELQHKALALDLQ